jgi:hypothetical protein
MKNQKSKKRKQSGGEPDFLGMALSASRKRKPNEDGVPTLFKEDVGDAGLKTKRDSTREGSNFDIRLTKEEKRRRKERQVRCASTSRHYHCHVANIFAKRNILLLFR